MKIDIFIPDYAVKQIQQGLDLEKYAVKHNEKTGKAIIDYVLNNMTYWNYILTVVVNNTDNGCIPYLLDKVKGQNHIPSLMNDLYKRIHMLAPQYDYVIAEDGYFLDIFLTEGKENTIEYDRAKKALIYDNIRDWVHCNKDKAYNPDRNYDYIDAMDNLLRRLGCIGPAIAVRHTRGDHPGDIHSELVLAVEEGERLATIDLRDGWYYEIESNYTTLSHMIVFRKDQFDILVTQLIVAIRNMWNNPNIIRVLESIE